MNKQEKIEKLADYAHQSWSRWMKHIFKKSDTMPKGLYFSGKEIQRRQKLIATPYKDLSENEKESDRKEARKMLEILGEQPTCETCEYLREYHHGGHDCHYFAEVEKDFYCKYHEQVTKNDENVTIERSK